MSINSMMTFVLAGSAGSESHCLWAGWNAGNVGFVATQYGRGLQGSPLTSQSGDHRTMWGGPTHRQRCPFEITCPEYSKTTTSRFYFTPSFSSFVSFINPKDQYIQFLSFDYMNWGTKCNTLGIFFIALGPSRGEKCPNLNRDLPWKIVRHLNISRTARAEGFSSLQQPELSALQKLLAQHREWDQLYAAESRRSKKVFNRSKKQGKPPT